MRIIAALATLLACGCASATAERPPGIESQLQAIEAASGGRLGVALANSDGRILAHHRPDERFAFCSTFKLLLAGMVLDGYQAGRWSLDEKLPLTKEDIVFHSPVTKTRLGQAGSPSGMRHVAS